MNIFHSKWHQYVNCKKYVIAFISGYSNPFVIYGVVNFSQLKLILSKSNICYSFFPSLFILTNLCEKGKQNALKLWHILLDRYWYSYDRFSFNIQCRGQILEHTTEADSLKVVFWAVLISKCSFWYQKRLLSTL